MEIYLLNVILIIIYGVLYRLKGIKVKKILFCLSICQLVLICGLRNVETVGKDWTYYGKYYLLQLNWNFQQLQDYTRYEIGFKILTKIISIIWNNKNFYAFILATLSIVPIGYTIYKYSKLPFLSIIIYISLDFYAFMFSGLRQAIAIAILLYSYKYIVNNNKFKFIVANLLAISCHYSSIVFLPVIFLRKIKLTRNKIILIGIIGVVIFLGKNAIFSFINTFFYDNYTSSVTNSYNWMLMCIGITCLCLICYKKVIENNKSANKLYVIVSIGAIMMLFSPIVSDTLRIANYFYIFIILLIPEVIYNIKKNNDKVSILTVTTFILFAIYIYLLKVDGYGIVPYKTFFM